MNKKIYVLIGEADGTKPIEDFQTIKSDDIKTLFPCSVDILYIDKFNLLLQNSAMSFFETALDKIKPGGRFLVKLFDLKKLCNLYANGNIKEEEFFQNMRHINNYINYMDIFSYCNNKNCKISDIKKNGVTSLISILKTGI